MTTHEKLITAEELLCLPDNGMRQELIDGKVVEMPPPGVPHGRVMSRVDRLLGPFAEEHDLGEVLCGDPGIILARGPDTVRGPDVCFFAKGRLPGDSQGYTGVVPDLVVEIVSPSERPGYVRDKTNAWLRAGVRLVIYLYPETRSAVVTTAAGATRLTEDDTLTCEPVLPGFSVRVGALFP